MKFKSLVFVLLAFSLPCCSSAQTASAITPLPQRIILLTPLLTYPLIYYLVAAG